MHVLDNPVWHALTGPQQKVADARSAAARYDPDVAPFAAVPDAPTAGTWDDLRDLVGQAERPSSCAKPLAVPDGWAELFRLPTAQMVATTVEPAPAVDAALLGPSDVDDMLALGRPHPPRAVRAPHDRARRLPRCPRRPAPSSPWPGCACICPATRRSARCARTKPLAAAGWPARWCAISSAASSIEARRPMLHVMTTNVTRSGSTTSSGSRSGENKTSSAYALRSSIPLDGGQHRARGR